MLLVLLRVRPFDGRVMTAARSSYVAWVSRGFWPKRPKAQGAVVEVGKKEKGVTLEDIVSLKCLWMGEEMAASPPPCFLKALLPWFSLEGRVRQILCSISGVVQDNRHVIVPCRSFPYPSKLLIHVLVTFTHSRLLPGLVQWPPCVVKNNS